MTLSELLQENIIHDNFEVCKIFRLDSWVNYQHLVSNAPRIISLVWYYTWLFTKAYCTR
jgi:hypothetical protein